MSGMPSLESGPKLSSKLNGDPRNDGHGKRQSLCGRRPVGWREEEEKGEKKKLRIRGA
jgi:hypothetical protein